MLLRIFTAYPEYFEQSLSISLLGKTRERGVWSLEIVNLRDYGIGRHKKIDDTSFGGGSGLILRPDVLSNALEDRIKNLENIRLGRAKNEALFITSPIGEILNQAMSVEMSRLETMNIICNRFEGVDQRVIDYYAIKPISIGRYVLLGGEVAACVIAESVLRLLPDFLKNPETITTESFGENLNGMGEYPQFTRPQIWNEIGVPEPLTNGNHREINEWRMANCIILDDGNC
jgi:tRNA (guanine37-N1)-methyltransferase